METRTDHPRARALRVVEQCPFCRSPLELDEGPDGRAVVVCIARHLGGCDFTEPFDKRSARLMDRILFLERELAKRDPDAPLWESEA